jgi:hypothetical protein
VVVVPAVAEAAVLPAPAPAPVARDRAAVRFALMVGAALLVGLALRVAIGLTDDAPSTDETAYLRSGQSLVAGDGFARGQGRPELHFPPLVPFLFGMAGKVVDDPHVGAVVLTTVSGTAAILPLALTARRLGGRRAGVATAWVAALTPAISTTLTNRGGGSEGEYVLLLALAVWLVTTSADHRGAARAVRVAGGGLSVGLAYLTRPEGLFAAVPLGVAVLYLALRDNRPDGEPGEARLRVWRRGGVRPVARAAVPVAAFGVPIVACVVPYAAFLHTHTGAWELSAKTNDASIEAWHAVARGDREGRDVVLYDIDDEFHFTAESHSLPSLARDDPGGYAAIVGTNAKVLWRTLFNPDGDMWMRWQLLPMPVWGLAIYGAVRHRSRAMAMVLAVAALPLVTALAFFVQPRYLVVTAALATIPVGVALAGFSHLSVGRARAATAVTVALCALSVGLAFHGGGGWWHPTDHTSQEGAGRWVAAHTEPGERIMARSQVVEYYSHRTTIALPYTDYAGILAYGRHYGVQYLVLDDNTVSRLRPQLGFLRFQNNAPGLELVHEAVGEGGTTRIFAFSPRTPADHAPPGPHLGFVGDGAA